MGMAQLARSSCLRHGAGIIAVSSGLILASSRNCKRTFLDSPASVSVSPATITSAPSPLQTFINRHHSSQSADKQVDKQSEKQETLKDHIKKQDAQKVSDTTDLDTYGPAFEDDDENSWAAFSRNVDVIKDGIGRIQWSGLGDKIADFVLPSWAKSIPGFVQKLQFELSMESGSLADEIWQEAHDPYINPEIQWSAKVRIGNTLGQDELRFLDRRKKYIVPAFAKYLGLKEEDINADDIPTIAMCGSGGGLRALVAGTSSYLSTQEAGLFDCVTYTAGVSGSCWLQSLYFSSVGKQNHRTLLEHIKGRIDTHIAFPPTALKLITSAPTNKFILSGFVEKLKGDPGASFGLVDAYSLLLAARLMVPKGDLDVRSEDLKLSNQREFIENGQNPLPIYTAVRHEIPVEEEEKTQRPATPSEEEAVKEKAKHEAWFQWFELTPFEVWCEEFSAGIPSWALGRPFENGVNKILDAGVALPEIRQSLLLGIYGSAFCATLSHYYKEIRPILTGISGFGGIDGLLEGKNQDLVKIHPIEPATIPNFVWGMKDKLPDTCPESVFKEDHLQLMDAGMSNNLPIYPLLRPGRDVDILIAFDASADIQKENWLSVVDGYAKQRGIKGWPIGAGWPKASTEPEKNAQILAEAQDEVTSTQVAASKITAAKESDRQQQKDEDPSAAEKQQTSQKSRGESPTTTPQAPNSSTSLSYCNIWIGTKQERSATPSEPPPPKRLSFDSDPTDSNFHLTSPDAGIAVIYFPLLPNPAVKDCDPDKSDYLSTWNFIYSPEQVERVAELAKRNFEMGGEDTRRTVRAVYERKKRMRLDKEKEGGWWKGSGGERKVEV